MSFGQHLKGLKPGQRPFYDNGEKGSCYMIHIQLSNGQATHYIGYSKSSPPVRRVAQHLAGCGAEDTKRYLKAGASLQLAYVWENVHAAFEYFLKGLQGHGQYCPLCKSHKWPIPRASDMPPTCFDSSEAGKQLRQKRIKEGLK